MEQNRRLTKKILKNENGQLAIEAVLLMTIFIGTFLFFTKQLREKQTMQNFADVSISKVRNMSEFGAWKNPCSSIKGGPSQRAANCHPNSINRALSSDPL